MPENKPHAEEEEGKGSPISLTLRQSMRLGTGPWAVCGKPRGCSLREGAEEQEWPMQKGSPLSCLQSYSQRAPCCAQTTHPSKALV